MFFKGIALIVAAVLLAITGCGLSTGESAPPTPSPNFSGKGYACVGQIPDHLASYFNDELSDSQVNDFVACLQKSFTSFAQLTRGRDENTYAPEEIRRFLQDYFFRERKISDQLMQEFMVIKQALIGGSQQRLTRTELYVIVDVLEDVRKEALRLKPHLKVLNPKLAAKQNTRDLGERLNRANDALARTIQTFANRLSKSLQPYAFANLSRFLTEFRNFVSWDVHFPAAKPAVEYVNLLRAFKDITVSPDTPNGIAPGEWEPLLGYMSRWYLSYLQYQIGVADRKVDGVVQVTPVLEGVGLQNLTFLAEQVFRLAEEAVRNQPTRTITYAQILRLAESAQKLGWLNARIRPASLQSALEATFSRLFGDISAPSSSRRVDGLKMSTISAMKNSFSIWAQIQQKLDVLYHPAPERRDVPSVRPGLLNRDVRAIIEDSTDSDWGEFMKIKNQKLMRPLFSENVSSDPNALTSVSVLYHDQLPAYGLFNEFYNLSYMNLDRALVSLMFRGYAENGVSAGWETGIKSPELQKFYSDYRSLGVDLGIVDPRNETAGERSFVEGNLFTYASDGVRVGQGLPSQLKLVEAMGLLADLYSGGMIANRLYDNLAKVCPLGPLDVKDLPKLDRCCVYQQMPDQVQKLFGNMPNLQKWLASLSRDQQVAYAQAVVNSVFIPRNSMKAWVEVNELSSLAVVMHYAETVLTRFDRNHDGRLDEVEVRTPDNETKLSALYIFSSYIQKFADDDGTVLDDAEARTAFQMILSEGRFPNKDDWSDGLFIKLWSNAEWWKFTYSLDRTKLAHVFAKVIEVIIQKAESKSAKLGLGPKPQTAPVPSSAELVQQCGGPQPGLASVQSFLDPLGTTKESPHENSHRPNVPVLGPGVRADH